MKPMEMNNIFILKDLISLGGGQIKGRKKMQKIVYIIQELKNPFKPSFKFEWNYYGVYSDELANELRIGEFFNIVKETPIEEYGYHSYAIETVNDTVTKSTPIKENIQLGELMKFLNDPNFDSGTLICALMPSCAIYIRPNTFKAKRLLYR